MIDPIVLIEDMFSLFVAAFATEQGQKVLADLRQLVGGNRPPQTPSTPVTPTSAAQTAMVEDTQPLPPIQQARTAAQQGNWQATAVNPPPQGAQSKWSSG